MSTPEDPQQLWSRPPDAPGTVVPPTQHRGNWWYQYPNGQWIWFSPEQNAWVPVQVTRSAKTPWWVWALIVLAVAGLVIGAIAFFSEIVDEVKREIEQERLRDEINVMRSFRSS